MTQIESLSHGGEAAAEAASQTRHGQPPASVEVPTRPALAPNVRLAGELQGSGFADRHWLIQRDSQFVQVSELLYRVAEQADGERTLEEIAAGVTAATDWLVSADNVRQLVQTRLIPLGLVATADGSVVSRGGARSALALNMRMKVIGPRFIDPIARVLQVFYAPPVLIPVLVIVAIAHAWLYLVHGVAASVRDALYTPGGLLIALALMLAAAVFHEFGHAAALRYSGGQVRGMGAGLYLIYPALYTDVTDSYRLGRWGRVRTDLGGIYFHLISVVGIIALYLLSGHEYLLFSAILVDIALLYQFIPFVRFDGYWALADLTGIPDFFSLMGPFVASVVPGLAWKGNKLPPLKPWVRTVFALFILITIPALAVLFYIMIKTLPSFLATTWDAVRWQIAVFSAGQSTRDVLAMVASVVQMLLLALPVVGTVYLLYSLGRRPIPALWRWSKPTPARRVGGGLISAGTIALVAFLWVPQLPFGTLQPGNPIEGVACGGAEMLAYHVHADLTLYENGRPVLLPANIGIPVSTAIVQNGQHFCFYYLHTHVFDHTLGIVHIESPTRRLYTLGQFFDIWQHTAVWDAQGGLGFSVDAAFVTALQRAAPGQIRAFVDGRPVSNYKTITLTAHKLITIEIGRPLRPPTTQFTFPKGE